MKVKELNHIALHVRNVAKSVNFYKNKLGLEQLPRPKFEFDGAWFRLGDHQELHLIGDFDGEVYNAPRGNHFALQVDSIKEAEDFLKQQNVTYRPPKPRPDGIWQLFLADPDGYFIELTELP